MSKPKTGPKGGTGTPPKQSEWSSAAEARYRAEAGGLLALTLAAAVPIRIHELKQRGGPTDTDFERVRPFGAELAERGDRLLFRGKKGESAELLNKLADSIAVMAFVPGGVKAFGQHYAATAKQDEAAA